MARSPARPSGAVRLEADREHWILVEAGAEVLGLAEELVLTHRIRSLDAVHLASALVVLRSTRLRLPPATADQKQDVAARALVPQVVRVG